MIAMNGRCEKRLPQDTLVRWIHGTTERTFPRLGEFRVVRQRANYPEVIRRVDALYHLGLQRSIGIVSAPDLEGD